MNVKFLAYFAISLLVVVLLGGTTLVSAVTNLDIPLPSSLGESYGTFKVNESIVLLQTCTNETAFCDSCNITSLKYDGDVLTTVNLAMTQNTALFNHTIPATNIQNSGHYTVTGFCVAGSIYSPWAYDFEVTPTGIAPSAARDGAIQQGIYSLFIITVLFFIAFLVIPNDEDDQKLFSLNKTLKWSFFMLSILFMVMGVNLVSISLFNEAVAEGLTNIFDRLGAVSYYMIWLVAGLLLFFWIFSFFKWLGDSQRLAQARRVGGDFPLR